MENDVSCVCVFVRVCVCVRVCVRACLYIYIYAAVVTFVAGSHEAGGLPGYPEVFLIIEINVTKSWQSFVALYFTEMS